MGKISRNIKVYLALILGLLSIAPCSAIFSFGETLSILPACTTFILFQIPLIFGAVAIYLGFVSMRNKSITLVAISMAGMLLGLAGLALHIMYSVYMLPLILIIS